ncbi:SirB2 family protein [Vibrio sp. SCSIO 43136]|uniref:SirB2 family protein n=1 Tax=Vibrio sp. SCSIO 43136 TaxID=2819101 RepID=UPI0020763793|nr:SirB2 family protein [Vibrio sp. SCSIO 43136]USD64639.1 SirB2 family protein [Vibrio sp. SCSIO 43136]
MYTALKHIHLISIAISAILLIVRYSLMMGKEPSPWLQHGLLKRLPHIVDSILLLTGLGLIYLTGFIPYTPEGAWLTEKLTCVMAYFALAFFTLKLAKNGLLRTFGFLGALGWLIMAGNMATTKVPSLLG